MTTWHHTRRGRIEGTVVREDLDWVTIQLAADSPRASTRARGRGPIDEAGELVTVRRSFLTEVGGAAT